MRKQQYKVTKARRMLAGLILAGSFVGTTVAYASVGKSGAVYYQNNKMAARVSGYVDLVDMPTPYQDKVYYHARLGGPYWETTWGKATLKINGKTKKTKRLDIYDCKIDPTNIKCGTGNTSASMKLYLAADGRTKTITDKDTR